MALMMAGMSVGHPQIGPVGSSMSVLRMCCSSVDGNRTEPL